MLQARRHMVSVVALGHPRFLRILAQCVLWRSGARGGVLLQTERARTHSWWQAGDFEPLARSMRVNRTITAFLFFCAALAVRSRRRLLVFGARGLYNR